MIDGSVVPTATAPTRPAPGSPGVEITAPPTPNRPDSTPVATPVDAGEHVAQRPGSIGPVADRTTAAALDRRDPPDVP